MIKRHRLLLPLTLVAPISVSAPAFAQAPPPVAAPPPMAPLAAPAAPATPPPPSSPPVTAPPPHYPQPWITAEFSTLRLLREKGVLSQGEYDSALHDLVETSGARAADDTTFVVGKFAATLYGFAEFDGIWDSTQSFSDIAGNSQVKTSNAFEGNNSRMQFGIRNSRFGIRVKSPSTRWFRASGVLEMDFEGATLPIGSGQPYYGSEAAFFNNPTFRMRHGYVKFETPVVDLLFGQTWALFGWGSMAFPTTVQIQGLPAEVFSRTAQARISHTFRSEYVDFELAVAASRPPQRDSGMPDGQAGFRFSFPKWTGMQTMNSTGTQIAPLTLGVSSTVRKLAPTDWSEQANEAAAGKTIAAKTSSSTLGYGVAVDLFAPLVPATADHKGNSLSISGEFVYGKGIADLYTGLTGGVPIAPGLPNPLKTSPTPAYATNIDPGLVSYTVDAAGNAALNAIQWTTFNAGAQYYFPKLDGRLFVSANIARTGSTNSGDLLGVIDPNNAANAKAVATARSKIRDHELWYDFNVMGDPYPGVRLGLEYANFRDDYLDGTVAVNHRVQFSGFYIF